MNAKVLVSAVVVILGFAVGIALWIAVATLVASHPTEPGAYYCNRLSP